MVDRQPVIQCQGLGKTFDEGGLAVTVLSAVDLAVQPGEKLAIVGTSGSGKSTLLHLLGGLDLPSQGTVSICGQDVARLSDARRGRLRNRHLGFIYQFHHLLPEFTALENVAMPLLIRGEPPAKAAEQAKNLLTQVGLAERIAHKPGELSGGERQRAAIARALITDPQAVLADEPTGNLDRARAEEIFQLMLHLNRQLGTAFVVVTHDMQLAERMDRIMMLEAGQLRPWCRSTPAAQTGQTSPLEIQSSQDMQSP
ncbi:lipoprotein-releasing system ATP-binding protein [Ectothiorhodospira magna]|uniref:Lipoprotein-releasing system ATP-binding protein LolD n=1 Tax=Ectothiorhodospira magna TaxID=867345 RepID=A0A1H9APW4_9GAMM|nr:lipoprotein-releasing ABC transporter ATP-binding protein LolD [Ectothiorhodospira magna]SEP78699.1 lipoprotein-releasing system ATP-binding protein [Ectothiorhodospira magna]